ncbi:hypothetical protein NC652_025438 [Populus alba x Populus x berolinensis]|nr:hypothetical protein NC652_025438 [Populus alba x Populus x berolinensis]
MVERRRELTFHTSRCLVGGSVIHFFKGDEALAAINCASEIKWWSKGEIKCPFDHVTVRESVVDVLSEISKYCDIYLMERTLDDESGKLADIGFTFQPLDQFPASLNSEVERINFKKYELEALFSLKGGKMEWRFRELLRVEKFCYLLNVPNSSEVICPPPLDDVNDSAELFGLNRWKVLAMIQGCKIRPLGLVHRCGGLGFGVASEFNGVVLVMGLVGAWLVLQVGCEVSGVGSGGAV